MHSNIKNFWKCQAMSPEMKALIREMRGRTFSAVPADQHERDLLSMRTQAYVQGSVMHPEYFVKATDYSV